MKKLILGLLIFGLTTQVYSQNIETEELEETVISINYKYLNAVDSLSTPIAVKRLEEKVINYDSSELAELYVDKNDTYSVSFYIPEGKIVAAYDIDGKIVRTIEKYNNIKLPLVVTQAITKRFPNWGIIEDVYLIKFHCDEDHLKQVYKVKLKNEDEIMTVKTNEKGEFI
ncbi:nicotinate-nucleotide adenylyltransferase [Flaviramulus sp. BrNp1-15]|uniref:nicotinate-nucleotide adenylyltransferase n=1 Tax=Flaviramulus sp. BrNp1-15 TaxID=2916754 RepID=UPI001EE849DC|nr:nicotinate-nucleotide adenylyltransferase [Flaviramulus sp. BrNp1-15]ULC57974.1 nicotinate-nucleotide adenylyltransferase [Flaviramulus sp. BrNp1-15]